MPTRIPPLHKINRSRRARRATGVYLAVDPGYQIGGRYAHRVAGSQQRRLQLVVVRLAAAGCAAGSVPSGK